MSLKDEPYPSSEDTYLLLDTLKDDLEQILQSLGDGGVVVEIGCGSGEVSKFVANLVDKEPVLVLSTDVNNVAITHTKEHLDNTRSELVCADLFSGFRKNTQFNVVIFNPPYVPTNQEEFRRALTKRDISASWAGGQHGREVIDRFLRDVSSYMSDNGVVYLVVIDVNNVEDTLTYARRFSLRGGVIAERRAGIEKLYVLRLYKILAISREQVDH